MKIADLATTFLSATAQTFLPNTRLADAYAPSLFSRAFPDLAIKAIAPANLAPIYSSAAPNLCDPETAWVSLPALRKPAIIGQNPTRTA